MSTEHQQYSLENQSTAIQRYADSQGFEVVRIYSDAAKSGFVLRHRIGLRQLLQDVVSGSPVYRESLVYDRGLHMLGVRDWKDRLSRSWRKIKTESGHIEIGLAPKLRINRHDGGVSLDLLLVNDAGMTVWVEEAIVVLTDLDAIWQTSIPTGQARHEIRQNITANKSLELSLVGAIYDAAGRPQGRYSCLICVDVRYRVGDEWFNKTLDTYKLEMNALKMLGLRRSRLYEKKVRPSDRPA